ncbi:zinc finger C3HC4 type domain containing protein [Nitzschia inconspicua]|uniref:Zinc finger C3HC4 type domain containing protein n=1 Tax=Nitzschia inconspicua TaxID=303405 RepID=A0A9K3P9C0_9STRA|nr:zinc finger C3HC4 type domain containing protein [Nitzschia inconspicua]KAG7362151.1 zinc finger C3HC4 type domain containing protein [Nitzschia inconspicua]
MTTKTNIEGRKVNDDDDSIDTEELSNWILGETVHNVRFMWAINVVFVLILLNLQAAYGNLEHDYRVLSEKLVQQSAHSSIAGNGVWMVPRFSWYLGMIISMVIGIACFILQKVAPLLWRGSKMARLQREFDEIVGKLVTLQETHCNTCAELETLRQSNETSQQQAILRESSLLQQLVVMGEERDIAQQELGQVEAERVSLERIVAEQERPPRTDCTVCLDSPVNTAMAPCGHTLCGVCANALTARLNQRCPICRAPFRQMMRIHIG